MRRVHVPALSPGLLTPDARQAHHLRAVLRLTDGETVEAFDAAGRTALAVVASTGPALTLRVDAVAAPPGGPAVTVAAAVPKGERADWLVEKLSEIGVARYVPLRTERSVVHPEGRGKLTRWERLAVESAKQCRRAGLMTIDPLTPLADVVAAAEPATSVYLSTDPAAAPFKAVAGRVPTLLLVGPEGDWSPDEEAAMRQAGFAPASLGRTILRVETAAVAAATLALIGSL